MLNLIIFMSKMVFISLVILDVQLFLIIACQLRKVTLVICPRKSLMRIMITLTRLISSPWELLFMNSFADRVCQNQDVNFLILKRASCHSCLVIRCNFRTCSRYYTLLNLPEILSDFWFKNCQNIVCDSLFSMFFT